MSRIWISTRSWLSPTRRHCVRRQEVATLMLCGPTITRAASTLPDLLSIDQKWHQRWQDASKSPIATRRESNKPPSKSYVLAMFPYPSGALHMGHVRVYTITDVLARFRSMQGRDVLYPMGWDAFGLPAENAAIERGVHPAAWTQQNTANMKAQLQAMNAGMDWSKEFTTCSPDYYKHTQRLFLLLHQHGFAYRAESLVNYDPVDRTVLANEQVDANGLSWRSGAKVERMNLRQWFLKISAFREALLDDLDFLGEKGRWPDRVLAMQRHWLGKSEGAKIKFQVTDRAPGHQTAQAVEVFTTRPDTLFGVQYLALSASHPLVKVRAAQDPDLAAFLGNVSNLPAESKAGYEIPGLSATNPLCQVPGTAESISGSIPVFVAPYVLEEYGSGAVMGVPGHDTRDFAFWSQNRSGHAVKHVVIPERHPQEGHGPIPQEALTEAGYLSDACQPYTGLSTSQATDRIVADLYAAGGLAAKSQTWRLRDWLISRQRYWGCPIPIIHCNDCGPVPVPESDLPVELPEVDGSWFKGRGGNPLEADTSWIKVPCPQCGSTAKRDTDTMDTFMDSSWYFFRFVDAHNSERMFDPAAVDAALPVDIYVGGIEHAILHLLYARFISKFLASIGEWPAGAHPEVRGEPFTRLVSQGMVHGKTYSDPYSGRFLKPEEIDLSDPAQPKMALTGEKVVLSFEKMSKSKHNGVDPGAFIGKYGADVTRAHILFQAPVTDVLEWDEDRIVGVQRWFQRIWRVVRQAALLHATSNSTPALDRYTSAEVDLHNALHGTIASITEALEHTYTLNTCVSDLMQLTNAVHGAEIKPAAAAAAAAAAAGAGQPESADGVSPSLFVEAAHTLVRLLAPFAPAFASECWEVLHGSAAQATADQSLSQEYADVFTERFPTVDAFPALAPRSQTVAVMQNGKLRFTVEVPVPTSRLLQGDKVDELQMWLMDKLRASARASKWLEGREWKRVVVARGGKTINFVG